MKKIAAELLKIATEITSLEVGKTYRVKGEFSVYFKEGHEAVSPHSGQQSTAVNLMEGNTVKILSKRNNHWYEAKMLHPIMLNDNGRTFKHQGDILIPVMEIDNLEEV
jgi:hypothetical protein